MAIDTILPDDPVMPECNAAKYLRMSIRRLYALRKTGTIAYIQDGKRVKYRRSQLEAYLNRLTIPSTEVH